MKKLLFKIREFLRIPVETPSIMAGAPWFVCYIGEDYVLHPLAFFMSYDDAVLFISALQSQRSFGFSLRICNSYGKVYKIFL